MVGGEKAMEETESSGGETTSTLFIGLCGEAAGPVPNPLPPGDWPNTDGDPNPVLTVLDPKVGAADEAPNNGAAFCVPNPNDMVTVKSEIGSWIRIRSHVRHNRTTAQVRLTLCAHVSARLFPFAGVFRRLSLNLLAHRTQFFYYSFRKALGSLFSRISDPREPEPACSTSSSTSTIIAMVENGASVVTEERTGTSLRTNGSVNGHGTGTKQVGKAIVVLGAQWGDEGKGKLVDLLVANENGAMNVCRCQVSAAHHISTLFPRLSAA
jgi:hypothetical protein